MSKNEVKGAIRHHGISVVQFTLQQEHFCKKPACWRINSVFLYNSMPTKNLSILCLLGKIFLLKHIYNARIKISSASQYTVSWTCTGTNNQLTLKYCSKSVKITKKNYQQPHTCFVTVIYLKIMKRHRYIMERNGKPCYANKIAPKSFVIRVNRRALISMTAPSCFTNKSEYATIKKKDT